MVTSNVTAAANRGVLPDTAQLMSIEVPKAVRAAIEKDVEAKKPSEKKLSWAWALGGIVGIHALMMGRYTYAILRAITTWTLFLGPWLLGEHLRVPAQVGHDGMLLLWAVDYAYMHWWLKQWKDTRVKDAELGFRLGEYVRAQCLPENSDSVLRETVTRYVRETTYRKKWILWAWAVGCLFGIHNLMMGSVTYCLQKLYIVLLLFIAGAFSSLSWELVLGLTALWLVELLYVLGTFHWGEKKRIARLLRGDELGRQAKTLIATPSTADSAKPERSTN